MPPDVDSWIRPRPNGAPPRLAVGTMNFGRRTPEPEASRIVHRALERGLALFDTANVYGDGESERILGRALRGRRDQAVIATKVGLARRDKKAEGLSRGAVLAAARASLERLGVDRIDVYYLHAPDPRTPIDETLDAITELVAGGVVGSFGLSNYASWQILETALRCDARSLSRPAVSQVVYNLLLRQLDVEYWKFTERYPIHTTVYNPLAGGLLAGRHRPGEPPAGSRFDKNALYLGRYWSQRFFDLVDAYAEVARSEEMTLVELAYAWIAGCPGVDSILVGPATIEHLDAAIDACERRVSDEGRTRIDRIHRDALGTETTYAR